MNTSLGRIVILVEDYDEALDFYKNKFGCHVIHDSTAGETRYLHVAFKHDDAVGIWFIQANNDNTHCCLGKQTGSAPTFVVYTDDCQRTYDKLKNNSVKVSEEIGHSAGSNYFYCEDLYGNEIVFAELKRG